MTCVYMDLWQCVYRISPLQCFSVIFQLMVYSIFFSIYKLGPRKICIFSKVYFFENNPNQAQTSHFPLSPTSRFLILSLSITCKRKEYYFKYDTLELQDYLRSDQVLSIKEKSFIFAARSNMMDLKCNFKIVKADYYVKNEVVIMKQKNTF